VVKSHWKRFSSNVTSNYSQRSISVKIYFLKIPELMRKLSLSEIDAATVPPILIHAVKLVLDHAKTNDEDLKLLLCCEKYIVGRELHGPVDRYCFN
jgi:hypothetical protein